MGGKWGNAKNSKFGELAVDFGQILNLGVFGGCLEITSIICRKIYIVRHWEFVFLWCNCLSFWVFVGLWLGVILV